VFTDRTVCGITANRVKAEGWLVQNPIVLTTLNPLIEEQVREVQFASNGAGLWKVQKVPVYHS